MPKIPLAALIAQNPADGDRINFFTWFYSRFDNAQVALQTITNVEPLYYQGAIAGTEFLTYANTKLYLSLNLTGGAVGALAGFPVIQLYNEANAISHQLWKGNIWWDTTAAVAKYSGNDVLLATTYFSRLAVTGYAQISFNGYRITLV